MTEKGRFTIPTGSPICVQSVLLTFDFFAPCADCKDGRFRLRLCRAVYHPWLEMEELQVPKIIELLSVSFRAFRGSSSDRVALPARRGPAEPPLVLAQFDKLARLPGLATLVVQRSRRSRRAHPTQIRNVLITWDNCRTLKLIKSPIGQPEIRFSFSRSITSISCFLRVLASVVSVLSVVS